ncbi:hypothetical protein LTR28_006881 [Elasticomyces elasticus]|nr:hypothetical protein LTR28_006881 [Elasticomyces elasticus]
MDSLSVPTSEQLREIAARQDAKEKETKATKSRKQIGDEEAAAELIQTDFTARKVIEESSYRFKG